MKFWVVLCGARSWALCPVPGDTRVALSTGSAAGAVFTAGDLEQMAFKGHLQLNSMIPLTQDIL